MTLNKLKNSLAGGDELKPALALDKVDTNDPEDGDLDEEGFAGTAQDPEKVEEMDTEEREKAVGIKYEDGEELDLNKKLQEADKG